MRRHRTAGVRLASRSVSARSAGFTLLEVMVALTVLALALAAVIEGAGRAAGNARYLRDKTLANWVALNRITEVQVLNQWPSVDVHRGTAPMAGREWHWTMTVTATPDKDVRRAELEVRYERDGPEVLITRVGFLPRPRAAVGGAG